MRNHYLSIAFMFVAPAAAWAHGEGAHNHVGLIAGLIHPFSGLDHLLAVLAVGLWAAQQGGRARWILPLSFVSAMAAGVALGADGMALPGVEVGIGVSVLALGILLALQTRWVLPLASLTVGTFALFHGAAHGQEMPLIATPWVYGVGILAATAALHAMGVLAGRKLHKTWMRAAGVTLSLAGLGLMLT